MIIVNTENSSVKITSGKIRLIKIILQIILRKHRLSDAYLSITMVDNEDIKKLNRRYLRRNRVTDVLAFPLRDWLGRDRILGEIVVSTQPAGSEARKRKIPVLQEILRYCIHGLLHLLDYNDLDRPSKKKMWGKQEFFLLKYGKNLI